MKRYYLNHITLLLPYWGHSWNNLEMMLFVRVTPRKDTVGIIGLNVRGYYSIQNMRSIVDSLVANQVIDAYVE